MRPALLLLLLTAVPALAQAPEPAEAQGHLVIVGGGGTPLAVRKAALARCPDQARVVVFPQASRRDDRGADAPAFWGEAGAGEVLVVDPIDPPAAVAAVASADLIWLPGGSQNRLLEALDAAGLSDAIRARHRAGAVVAGTSAGAAVMGPWMLTGEANLEGVTRGTTELVPGLGLWPGAIVDQHFLQRRRNNRLLAAVLDRPQLVGVGIDERTAVIVSAGSIEVVGEGGVLIYDARAATVAEGNDSEPHAAEGVQLHVLRQGSRLPWRAD